MASIQYKVCFRLQKTLVTRRYMVATGDRETKIRKTDRGWRAKNTEMESRKGNKWL